MIKYYSIPSMLAAIGLALFATAGLSLTAADAVAEEMESKIAHGGLLYDKWYKIAIGSAPKGTHPSYGTKGKKKGKGTWRCKECHGWDYKGKDGRYGSGSHYSGIKGIRESAGKSVDAIIAVLKDDTHQMTNSMMNDTEFRNIALFVSKGQHDTDKIVDRKTAMVNGNKEKGAAYYNTICARCHGMDGRGLKDMPVSLGKVAVDNPWETLHKIRNGQPAEGMPALRALPMDITVDITAYAQTLPQTK